MKKMVLILLLGNSLLFSYSFFSKAEKMNVININNKSFIDQGNSMRMYFFDFEPKNRVYYEKYDVEWDRNSQVNLRKRNLINYYCSNTQLRGVLNKGFSYNMTFRNKITKKIIINFSFAKKDCY